MSGVKLTSQIETWLEVQAECAACGMPVLSEAGNVPWPDDTFGKKIVVKVRPCARCAREAAEQVGGPTTCSREGVRS